MTYLTQFSNERLIESLFRDAWLGLYLHHNRPTAQRLPARTLEEAANRLEEFTLEQLALPHMTSDGPMASITADLRQLYASLGSEPCLEYLESLQGVYSPKPRTDVCSDKMYAYLKRLGFAGKRPSPQEARRLIGQYRRQVT